MSRGTSLFQSFHASVIDDGELSDILSDHFRTSTVPQGSTHVFYPGTTDHYGVKLVYRKNRLVDIVRGPALTDEEVATLQGRIEQDLLGSVAAGIGISVQFSGVPVVGYYQYRDKFQIRPVPPGAPTVPYLIAAHPFLLEYAYPASTSWSVNVRRSGARLSRIELVLMGLVRYMRGGLPWDARHHWVIR